MLNLVPFRISRKTCVNPALMLRINLKFAFTDTFTQIITLNTRLLGILKNINGFRHKRLNRESIYLSIYLFIHPSIYLSI